MKDFQLERPGSASKEIIIRHCQSSWAYAHLSDWGNKGRGEGEGGSGRFDFLARKKKIAKSYSFSTHKKLFRPWRCPEMLIILSMLFTMTFIAIGALNTDDNEAIKYILTHCALKVSPQAPESAERLGMPGRGG